MKYDNPLYLSAIKQSLVSVVLNYIAPPLYLRGYDVDSLHRVWNRYELMLKMVIESTDIDTINQEIAEYDAFFQEHVEPDVWKNSLTIELMNGIQKNIKDMIDNELNKAGLWSKMKVNIAGYIIRAFAKSPILLKSPVPSYDYFNEAFNFCQKYNINGLSFSLLEPYSENYFYDLNALFESFIKTTGYPLDLISLNGTLNLKLNNTTDFTINKKQDREQFESLGYFSADKNSKQITGDMTLMIRAIHDNRMLEVLIHEHTHALDYFIGKKIAVSENTENAFLFSNAQESLLDKYDFLTEEYRNVLFKSYDFENKTTLSQYECNATFGYATDALIMRMFSQFYGRDSEELKEMMYYSPVIFEDIKDRLLGKTEGESAYADLKLLFNQPTSFIDNIVAHHISEIKIILFSSDMQLKCFYMTPNNKAERGFDAPHDHYSYFLSIEERFANAVALSAIHNDTEVMEAVKDLWQEAVKL